MNTTVQVPWIVLPQVWVTGAEMETINDLVEHTSIDIPLLEFIQEKTIQIVATELIAAGVPGALWCWIELSPVPSATSTAYWAAIGGGGGALPPVAPLIEAATGVNLTVHTMLIPWSIHSPFARLVMQTPVAAAPATAFWSVQAMIQGKAV